VSPDERGWFAHVDEDRDPADRFLWQPNIQVAGAIFPLPAWFDTEAGCEEFIRREIVGQGWMNGPSRYACPDCGVGADQWCVNLVTGEKRFTFHTDRMRFQFGGWPE
jgi:hypothetical protein